MQQEEWLSKDLVVDTRETWGKWAKRQVNFEDPPLIPREDLPEVNQPHRSFYGKMSCFMNGIDPYPGEVSRRHNTMPVVHNPIESSSDTSIS